jgi:hypothetical protein
MGGVVCVCVCVCVLVVIIPPSIFTRYASLVKSDGGLATLFFLLVKFIILWLCCGLLSVASK